MYTDELADEFCLRVAQGRSISSVCADTDMPSQDTIYRWHREKAGFSEKLTHAREERLEAYSERMLALGTRVIEEPDLDPQRVNSAVNAIDKAARLQAPKQRIEHSGKIETTETDSRQLSRAILAVLSEATLEEPEE